MYECKIRPYHPALLSSPSPCRPPGLAGSGWRPRRTPPGFAAKRSWSAPGRPLVDNQMLTDMDPHNYKTWQCDNVFLSSAVACHKNRTIEQWTVNMDQDATVNSEQWTVHTDNNKHMLQIWSMQHKSQGSLREKYCSTPFGMARSIRWT